jgi:hypothetical protein
MLSYRGLSAVVFQTEFGWWSFNIFGLRDGPLWSAKFGCEEAALVAVEAAFAKHAQPQGWRPRSLGEIWKERYPTTTKEDLEQAIARTMRQIETINDGLDSGAIEEKDEVNAHLHHTLIMRQYIKEMKQVLDETMVHKLEET